MIKPETIEKAKKNIPIEYTGIVIDQSNAIRVLEMFKKYYPSGWKVVNSLHATVKMGGISDGCLMKRLLDLPLYIIATHIGVSETSIALRVDIPKEIQSKNEIPHITLAYDVNNGASPKSSNNIANWEQLKRPIRIRGVFKEMPFKFNI